MLDILCRTFFHWCIYQPNTLSIYLLLGLNSNTTPLCGILTYSLIIKVIICLETVQRRATKLIVSDKFVDYKGRLTHLHLLPPMTEFEIFDIIFLVKSMKSPSAYFNIYNFFKPCNHSTCSSSSFNLRYSLSRNNTISSSYSNRPPKLWNHLQPQDISLSLHPLDIY